MFPLYMNTLSKKKKLPGRKNLSTGLSYRAKSRVVPIMNVSINKRVPWLREGWPLSTLHLIQVTSPTYTTSSINSFLTVGLGRPAHLKRGLQHNFGALFCEAMAKAASSRPLFCGDFNLPQMQWGCGADSLKGKRLAELIDELGRVVLNEPASHTRIEQGARRNMSPDLFLLSDARVIAWSNTFEDLRSYSEFCA